MHFQISEKGPSAIYRMQHCIATHTSYISYAKSRTYRFHASYGTDELGYDLKYVVCPPTVFHSIDLMWHV
jgi:hypothetical protein